MRSLVVFAAVLALSVSAPHDESELKKRSIGQEFAYAVPTSIIASPFVAEPFTEARAVYANPAVYGAPAAAVYSTGSAVSHQSRVDVRTSPAVVASGPAIFETAPIVEARSLYSAPVYAAPAAVSHQSRYDVQTSPAVISEQVVAPAVYDQQLVGAPAVVDARSIWSPSVYATSW